MNFSLHVFEYRPLAEGQIPILQRYMYYTASQTLSFFPLVKTSPVVHLGSTDEFCSCLETAHLPGEPCAWPRLLFTHRATLTREITERKNLKQTDQIKHPNICERFCLPSFLIRKIDLLLTHRVSAKTMAGNKKKTNLQRADFYRQITQISLNHCRCHGALLH